MARVHLLSAAPTGPSQPPKALLDLEQMQAAAAADTFDVHRTVTDPQDADLILFVETSAGAGPYFERVRRHPLYRRLRERSYAFCSTDRVVPLVPGVFASIERSAYLPDWTRSGHYLGVREGGSLTYDPDAEASTLFGFAGSAAAHPVRRRILEVPADGGALLDTHTQPLGPEAYARSLRDAAFALCPRGGGVSTFRLFEAMMLGRAPVIVSDEWVAPTGPSWEEFSVRVGEHEVGSIPRRLEALAAAAPAMGAAARSAWVQWFSPEASFHRTVEWCLELGERGSRRGGLRRLRPYSQMLRPYHASRAIKYRASRYGPPPTDER